MSFKKIGDSTLTKVIKEDDGEDKVMLVCPKCGVRYSSSTCPNCDGGSKKDGRESKSK